MHGFTQLLCSSLFCMTRKLKVLSLGGGGISNIVLSQVFDNSWEKITVSRQSSILLDITNFIQTKSLLRRTCPDVILFTADSYKGNGDLLTIPPSELSLQLKLTVAGFLNVVQTAYKIIQLQPLKHHTQPMN
jgi:hypothetical protein